MANSKFQMAPENHLPFALCHLTFAILFGVRTADPKTGHGVQRTLRPSDGLATKPSALTPWWVCFSVAFRRRIRPEGARQQAELRARERQRRANVRRGPLFRSRSGSLCASLSAYPFLLRRYPFGHLKSGQRSNELLHAERVKIHCSAIFIAFHNRSVTVLRVTNVLSSFESHCLTSRVSGVNRDRGRH
jgi:hypothetical protein